VISQFLAQKMYCADYFCCKFEEFFWGGAGDAQTPLFSVFPKIGHKKVLL